MTRAAVLHAWSAAGADLVLSGHIHRSFIMPVMNSSRGLWCVQAGTAVSRRVRHGEPNAVNLIRWSDGECAVEQWEHRGAAGFLRGDVQHGVDLGGQWVELRAHDDSSRHLRLWMMMR